MTRQKLSVEQIQQAITSGTITESVVLDLWAAYEAMQQERDANFAASLHNANTAVVAQNEVKLLKGFVDEHARLWETMKARAEAAEATVARLTEALSEVVARFGSLDNLKAITPDDAAHVRRTSMDRPPTVADVYRWHAALSASSTPDTTQTTTMRAADPSAFSDRQDLREVPDTKGSQR